VSHAGSVRDGADRSNVAASLTDPPRAIDVVRLGCMDYAAALALQEEFVERRRAATIGDTLLLVEHPAVITLGARNRVQSSQHVVATVQQLRDAGIAVCQTGRGGDVTYHGPGQLVGYPIIDLRPDRCDVHRYVRDLEEALIVALAQLGVEGKRLVGLSGVWVGEPGNEAKIAAIGVRISRWVTSHGFALNVSTNLSHFDLIVPCGIPDRGVTSIERVLGRPVPSRAVEVSVIAGMRHVFEAPPGEAR
jgi:lipoyl(octanoyl) transferase